MHPKHANNCRELQARFEGKEAIYAGHGVLRVRVHNIRAHVGFNVSAEVEEIPTPGLGVGVLRPYQNGFEPLRQGIGAGYLTCFSDNTWEVGYGGWTLYFSPVVIEAVIARARRLPETMDRYEAYCRMNIALALLRKYPGPSRNVFDDAVEPWTNNLRKSDAPPITIEASSEWVMCPYCDRRFKLSDPVRWNGERHSTCGQRPVIR